MEVSTVKSKLPPFLISVYRRSAVLQWLYGLTLRHHWREIHTRDSCVYGSRLSPFLIDLIERIVGIRQCDGRIVEDCESALASVLGVSHVVTFSSARNSLRAILKAMEIGEGDEVILPAFTCAVVPYTILHCGARPVYVDIRTDYRMNLDMLQSVLTQRTKAIIVQHTFGLPERVADILTLARTRDIRVIEDCAHVLPGTSHNGKTLGTWGDAAYFSFERGKTISSGWGGAAVTRDEAIGRGLCQIKQDVPPLSRDDNLRIGTRLLLTILLSHPNLFALGGLFRGSVARRGVFPDAMPPRERRGDPPDQLFGRLADTQAMLLLCQLRRLSLIAQHRRSCVRALSERLGNLPVDLPLMWYPLQVKNRDEAMKHFANHQIELRAWEAPLSPSDCDVARAQYRWGSCPTAEEMSRGCVALPTMLTEADLERVIAMALRYLDIVHVG